MLRFLRRFSKATLIILSPLIVLWSWLNFTFRFIFLGFPIACLYFQRIPKHALIPILRSFGATIGKGCDIETGIIFHNCYNYKNLSIGNNCHIGKNCFFDLRDKVTIENNVVISMQCSFITHIDMTKSKLNKIFPARKESILIKENTYIGVTSTILMGVEMGQNCFVAAKSLVKNSVSSNTVVGGIPAKKIKSIGEGI